MVVTNEGVETGFYCSEVGIYINDEGVEKLYWYINDANQSPWLGPEVDGPVKYRWWENILVTTQEVVIVNWTGKELLPQKKKLILSLMKNSSTIL